MIPSGFAGVIPFVREMENMMAEGERLMFEERIRQDERNKIEDARQKQLNDVVGLKCSDSCIVTRISINGYGNSRITCEKDYRTISALTSDDLAMQLSGNREFWNVGEYRVTFKTKREKGYRRVIFHYTPEFNDRGVQWTAYVWFVIDNSIIRNTLLGNTQTFFQELFDLQLNKTKTF